MGWIGDDVLHSLYRIADLCVVPSIYEPFGLVALEAMASGCPCIVADTGGLREVVPNSDVGLRFRSRNPRALATMMQRVLDDDALRERLVAEASVHVLRFDWNDVARQTAAVYAELGGAGGARRRPRCDRPEPSRYAESSRDLRPQRPAFLASSAFSPRPETIATTTQTVAIAGISTANVKSRPMLSDQPWLRAMSMAREDTGRDGCAAWSQPPPPGGCDAQDDDPHDDVPTGACGRRAGAGPLDLGDADAEHAEGWIDVRPRQRRRPGGLGRAARGARARPAARLRARQDRRRQALRRRGRIQRRLPVGELDRQGTALVHASGIVTADVPVALAVFLGDAVQAGDFASVVLRVDVAGASKALRARLLKLASGPFGYALQVEGFAGTVPALPGVTLELRNLTLDIGAKRRVTETVTKRVRVMRNGKRVTVRRKIKRKVTRTLIRNPKTCAGSWTARVTVRIAGSDRVKDVSVPCSKA